MDAIVTFIKGLFDTLNETVEPFVTPVLNYLNTIDYAIVALVFLGIILLALPGLFVYFKKAFKLFVFLVILLGLIYVVWEFVVKG